MLVLRVLLLVFFAQALSAFAANARIAIQRIDTDRGSVLLLDGEFSLSDDPHALAREVSASGARVVTFNSDGGNIISAIAFGRMIRTLGLSTVQLRSTQCASACALAFVGGIVRKAEPGAIGVHQSSFSPDEVLDGHTAVAAVQQITAQILTYLVEMGVDPKLLQLSLSVPSNDMRYLTAREMEEYRVTVGTMTDVPQKLSGADGTPSVQTTVHDSSVNTITTEDKALAFVSSYYEAWSRGNAEALTFMDRVYSETVNFYGKTKTRIFVVDEKVKFVMRWPVRAYNMKPGSTIVTCAAFCTVEGVVDWYAKRDVGNGVSSGSARFSISWEPATGRIVSESGEVLDIDKGASGPVRIISQWYDQNSACRGGAGNDEKTLAACQSREAISAKLEAVGWCYGREGEVGYQMDWHRCGSARQEQVSDGTYIASKSNKPLPGQYPVKGRYLGKTKLPDFKARDREFNSFRTRIRNGMRAGPNFAGHYSVIQIGCGAGCSFAIVSDNNSGRPARFPRGGEDNMYLDLDFRLESRLLAAQWLNYDTNKCVIEFFDFDRKNWNLISKREVGGADACYRSIRDNLR